MEYCLTDLCELIMGQSPDSSSCNKDGKGIPFYQGNADFGEKNPTPRNWCLQPKKIAQKDDILISVRAPIGDLNIANEDCCIGRGVAAIRMKSKECDRDYLYLFLESKSKYLQDCGTGSTFTAINKGVLETLKVKCPEIKKQITIANEIENIKTAIKYKKSELLCLNEAIQSEFVEMFGENPVESGKWKVKKLGDVCKIISGGTPDRKNEEYWKNGTIPWVKTTELQNNELSDIGEYITKKGLEESAAKIVPANTILLAMYGQGKTRGMTAFLQIEASTNQACACILPTDSKELTQRFIWYFLIMNYENIRNLAVGCNQLNLNSNLVKNIQLPVPPISLQNTFAAFVQQIDKSKFVLQQQMIFLKNMI